MINGQDLLLFDKIDLVETMSKSVRKQQAKESGPISYSIKGSIRSNIVGSPTYLLFHLNLFLPDFGVSVAAPTGLGIPLVGTAIIPFVFANLSL